jgi:hypothetical protein
MEYINIQMPASATSYVIQLAFHYHAALSCMASNMSYTVWNRMDLAGWIRLQPVVVNPSSKVPFPRKAMVNSVILMLNQEVYSRQTTD